MEESGIDVVYGALIEKFMEVFTPGAGNASAMKNFVVSKAPKAVA